MKVSEILRTAMVKEGIVNATELSNRSGISYGTVIRAINDENVGVVVVVELLDFMGYQLIAEVTKWLYITEYLNQLTLF